MRFEATFTNLLNHPNFAPPPTNVTSSSFGIVQSVQTAENSEVARANSACGSISSVLVRGFTIYNLFLAQE